MPTQPLSKCHNATIFESRFDGEKDAAQFTTRCGRCFKPCDVIEPTALESEQAIICTKCGNSDYIAKGNKAELCESCKSDNFVELIA